MARKDIKDHKGVTKLVIETDESGTVISAKDNAGNTAERGDAKSLKLNGEKVIDVSDGTVIRTGEGTCVWYFVGGSWYRVCW